MISKRHVSRTSYVSFMLVAALSAGSAIWFTSGSRSHDAVEFRAKEQRYQSQIQTLKLALKSNRAEFDRERSLAMRLQRELGDANRQIDELSRQLIGAQRTITQRNKQLKEVRARKTSVDGRKNSRQARLETSSALIVSRATSGLVLPSNAAKVDRRVSRYSPSKSKAKRAVINQKRQRTFASRRLRPTADPRRDRTRTVKVSSVGPVAASREIVQTQSWPLSNAFQPRVQRASVDRRGQRFEPRQVAPAVLPLPKVAQQRARRAKRARRVALARRRQVRQARYARYSRLGRLNRQRGRRVVRKRRARLSFMERMVRRGVFDNGR